MTKNATGVNCRHVLYDPSNDVASFAAEEWIRYVKQASGATVSPLTESDGSPQNTLILAVKDSPLFSSLPHPVQQAAGQLQFDGFVRGVHGGNAYVVADKPRGILFGVYDLLEKELGLAFGGPHDGEEYVPQDRDNLITQPLEVSNPAVELRIIGFHGGTTVDFPEHAADGRLNYDKGSWPEGPTGEYPFDWLKVIDWMTKRKYSGFQAFCAPYLARRDELVPEVRKRGIVVEFGGHSYTYLFSPVFGNNYMEEHPDYYAKNAEGEIQPANLCFANTAMREELVRRVLKILEECPEIDIFDLWPSDGAAFCKCGSCSQKAPEIWMLETTAQVAEVVKERFPHKYLAHLVYDFFTRPPETAATTPDNVITQHCAYWDRVQNRTLYDYRQGRRALKDAEDTRKIQAHGCEVRDHRQVCEEIDGWRSICPNGGMFTYYSDLIGKKVITNVVSAIKQDMNYYHAVGMKSFTDCLDFPHMWMSQALTLFALADLSWDRAGSPDDIILRFARGTFGAGTEDLISEYFSVIDELQNKPCFLGFNTLDMLHRSPKEVAHFAGVIDRLVRPTRAAFAAHMEHLNRIVGDLEATSTANTRAVYELRQATLLLDYYLRRNMALYLGCAYAAQGLTERGRQELATTEEIAQEMWNSSELSSRFNDRPNSQKAWQKMFDDLRDKLEKGSTGEGS